jgi:hypothetical protein
MDAHDALTEARQRQQQTLAAGAAPWSWRALLSGAAAWVGYGLALDLDMVWLVGVLVLVVIGVGGRAAVKLRSKRSPGWTVALVATFALALVVDIAVQFAVRGAGWSLPNTLGSLGAALTVLALARPIQARAAAARRS